MEKPAHFLKEVRKKVQSVTYGNPIYRLVLDQGPVPEKIHIALIDPWPGNAKQGQALLYQEAGLFDHPPSLEGAGVTAEPSCVLRDLRAVGTEAARRRAVQLIDGDIAQMEVWQDEAWHPAVLGERIAAWLAYHDFYSTFAPDGFEERLIHSLTRQLRHLLHLQPTALIGIEGLQVVKGLIYGGIALVEPEKCLTVAFDLLRRQLTAEVLEDGGHVSRNPSVQLHFLRLLIDMRAALRLVDIAMPDELDFAIGRMVPALKMFRHGDGSLALFHGGAEESSLWLDAALTLSEAKGRVLRRLPQSGYERVTAGRSLLLVDAAAPALRPYDAQAHAGLLSFEFSVGKERIIVNCGAAPDTGAERGAWRQALAATAAHSTLTLEDTNACEILALGLGHKPIEVKTQRYEQDGVQSVEISHNGYAARFNVWHQRTLSLSVDGETLSGREILAGRVRHDFALRWHLHPSVQASLAQNGQTALLRTPSGAGWRLRVSGGDLALEASVYASGDAPRRTLQLKVSGRASDDPTTLEWSLTREKK